MYLRAAICAVAVSIAPIAVAGAQGTTKAKAAEKRTCSVDLATGSRLGGVRRCRTKTERDREKQESKQVVERIQAMKPTMCPPAC